MGERASVAGLVTVALTAWVIVLQAKMLGVGERARVSDDAGVILDATEVGSGAEACATDAMACVSGGETASFRNGVGVLVRKRVTLGARVGDSCLFEGTVESTESFLERES